MAYTGSRQGAANESCAYGVVRQGNKIQTLQSLQIKLGSLICVTIMSGDGGRCLQAFQTKLMLCELIWLSGSCSVIPAPDACRSVAP
jgi:hypothetical protein